MPKKSPGVKAKALGRALRSIRMESGVTLTTAAEVLGLSKQVVSRLETGQRNISRDEVAALLGLYQVTGSRREQLLTMAATLNEPGWWEQTGLGKDSAALAAHEDSAHVITNWAPLLIPGLLQSLEYRTNYLTADGASQTQTESILSALLRRQYRLKRGDVKYVAYLGEPALVGTGKVHRDQLTALLRSAEEPHITIRVVPTTAFTPQARLGAFMVLEPPPVVHVELARSGVFVEAPEQVAPYLNTITHLGKAALDTQESVALISRIRDRMEG